MKRSCMASNFESQHDNYAFTMTSGHNTSIMSAGVVRTSALCAVIKGIPVSLCPVPVAILGILGKRR